MTKMDKLKQRCEALARKNSNLRRQVKQLNTAILRRNYLISKWSQEKLDSHDTLDLRIVDA